MWSTVSIRRMYGRMGGMRHIAQLTLFLSNCAEGVAECDHTSWLFSA
jgi:hypothetical protein